MPQTVSKLSASAVPAAAGLLAQEKQQPGVTWCAARHLQLLPQQDRALVVTWLRMVSLDPWLTLAAFAVPEIGVIALRTGRKQGHKKALCKKHGQAYSYNSVLNYCIQFLHPQMPQMLR